MDSKQVLSPLPQQVFPLLPEAIPVSDAVTFAPFAPRHESPLHKVPNAFLTQHPPQAIGQTAHSYKM